MSQHEHASVVRHQSKVFPEVHYTLRKMSRGRRIHFNRSIAPVNERLRELEREREPIQEKLEPIRKAARDAQCRCDHTPEQHHPETGICLEIGCTCRHPQFPKHLLRQLVDIGERETEIDNFEFQPALLRWGVESIEGYSVDGVAADVEVLIERGDERLFSEIFRELSKLIGLTKDETKNFDSPTTSGAVEVGETANTTAPSAENKGTS